MIFALVISIVFMVVFAQPQPPLSLVQYNALQTFFNSTSELHGP